MWRKTRSVNDGSTCLGTDANRNYDFQWDVEGIVGKPWQGRADNNDIQYFIHRYTQV